MFTHLSNIDSQEREKKTIFDLFAITTLPGELENFYNIYSRYYIIGINIPYHYILNGKHNIGDIDVCLIPCLQSPFNEVKIINPNLNKIFGIEVKTMAYLLDGKIKSAKFKFSNNLDSDSIQTSSRNQALKLYLNGFDDVSLLYILTTEPLETNHNNINDWFDAGEIALTASEIVNKYLDYSDKDNFSTLGLFIGSLIHKPEVFAATSIFKKYYHAKENNSINQRNNVFRIAFENEISKLFPIEVSTSRFPIQIRACSNNSCRKLYIALQGELKKCPECNSLPL